MNEREEAIDDLRAAVGIVTARLQLTSGAMDGEDYVALLVTELEERGSLDIASALASLAEVLVGVTSATTGQRPEEVLQSAARAIGTAE
jgi:hypothetical protein